MAGHSGGIASAFGFRYQYLITVEVLLELFENSETNDWAVEVDRAEQDSADIIVSPSASVPAGRVIQVKASMAESSTTIGVQKVREILMALANEHPAAISREVATNRTMSADLVRNLAATGSKLLGENEKFISRCETLCELTDSLLQRISRLRVTGAGGVGTDLNYLLLRQLVDMVHEAGSRPVDQSITLDAVRSVIQGAAPVLSNALGARRWGMCIQVPTGNFIERPTVTRFLRHNLPNTAIYEGTPRVAVIHGMSGTGKTSAASFFARSRLEQFAFVLWLDASSSETLESQLSAVLSQMGTRDSATNPTTEDLMTVLGELPVPWLLILDGAQSLIDVDAWVPRSGYGQTLITTTRADWPQDFAPALRLDEFSRAEARDFFAARFNQPESTWAPKHLAACEEIASRLSNWPLALELAVSWIKRRGGSLDVMRQFVERIDRLNLDDAHLLPHGYPRTAAQVVVDLWAELSPAAQRVVSVLLLLGGERVPERLIADWARRMDLRVDDPLEELFAASIIQRGITATGGTPHDYDETATVHDFLKLIARSRGVELEPATMETLIETCNHSISVVTQNGQFREGTALVHPVDHLLRELAKTPQLDMIYLSVLMHNLAQMAFFTSNAAVARKWYLAAFNVRRTDPERFERRSVGVGMQLQTLAGAAMVMALQHDQEGLKHVAENASDLMQGSDESIFQNPQTLHAVRSLRENVAVRLPEAIDQIASLGRLLPESDVWRQVSSGSDKVDRLQNEMERAITLVESGKWQQGVSTAIATASHALEESLLVHPMIDGLLDVGLLLTGGIAQRQHDLPEGILGDLQRVADWFRHSPAHLDELQRQRLALLRGLATGEPSSIRAAIETLPGKEELTPMVIAWSQLASGVADQLDRFRRYEKFADLPENMTIEIGVDGGNDINFWQSIESSTGMPILWVCTASRVRYDSKGKFDPVREAFVAAGLPQPNDSAGLRSAYGWSSTLREDALTIHDREGISRVIVDGLEPAFCDSIRTLGGLVLAYGDMALVAANEDPPPRGWVSLAVDIKTPQKDSESADQYQDANWLRGLLTRCARALRRNID